MIEWFGLEGTFKGYLVQPPCHERGHLQLDQVAQSPVQPDLECFQGWGIYNYYNAGDRAQILTLFRLLDQTMSCQALHGQGSQKQGGELPGSFIRCLNIEANSVTPLHRAPLACLSFTSSTSLLFEPSSY